MTIRSYFLVLTFAGGCHRSSAELPQPQTAVAAPIAAPAAPAQEVKVPRLLTLSGSLIGSEEAQVAAGVAGKVMTTYVERGAVVKKGAILVRLDARAVGAQAQEAAAQLESLKAQQAQALLDCQRNEQMFERGAVSKADHDRARTQCATTKWSVSAAEARKNLTAEALRDADIRAPFSGMIVERLVSPGEYVRPDSHVVTLVDVDSLRVELTVPEADVAQIHKGMQVAFRTASGDGVKPVQGRVRYIGPSVRKQTRDAVVEAVVDNPGHDLRPGMFVTASLSLGEQKVLAVPETAMRSEGTLRHVFVVQGGRLEDRLVQVAEAHGGLVPIMSGIKAGEPVVTKVTAEMRDGLRVQ